MARSPTQPAIRAGAFVDHSRRRDRLVGRTRQIRPPAMKRVSRRGGSRGRGVPSQRDQPELKSSFVFAGTKLAHFNFVGDSILGAGVNLEAGSVICNYRNERADKEVRVRIDGALHPTGCQKFGAVVGDQCRIGANAVVAPGALLVPGSVVARTSLRDDELPNRA